MTQDESTVQNSSWDQIVDGKKSAGELLSQEEKLKVFWLFVLARNDYNFKIMATACIFRFIAHAIILSRLP